MAKKIQVKDSVSTPFLTAKFIGQFAKGLFDMGSPQPKMSSQEFREKYGHLKVTNQQKMSAQEFRERYGHKLKVTNQQMIDAQKDNCDNLSKIDDQHLSKSHNADKHNANTVDDLNGKDVGESQSDNGLVQQSIFNGKDFDSKPSWENALKLAMKVGEKVLEHLEYMEELRTENERLQDHNQKLQQDFNDKFGDNDQYRLDLEEEQLELMIKNEELSEENKAILDEFLAMQQQHQALQLQLLQSQKKKYDYLKDRVAIYKNIVFEKDSFDEFVLLTEDDNRNVEEQIQLLNHKPDDANFRCKIASTNFLEIGFGSQGRMYVKKVGNCYHIYKIGNKATQTNDIKYLKTIS